MPPPDPEPLFEQAEVLANGSNQEDWRRAISTAYYAVFHFILTAAADKAIGAGNRAAELYRLAYRSIDHRNLRALCINLKGSQPQGVPIPSGGYGPVAQFARVTVNLYELRIQADYDPLGNFTANEASVAISEARKAVEYFQQGTAEQQEMFLALLLLKSRT